MPAPETPTVSGLPAEKLMAAAMGGTPVSSPAFAWVPPPVEAVAPWFPDYEVQSLAGRGAMGAVYRAVQRKLERPVAIKLLPAELAARDGISVRFEREARALAQLNHPGIVALHDFGRTEGGHLFIVMEYVDGTDLSRLLHAEGGALGVPQALEIVSQVCDALQYAHNHGFVHRDIKPGNVLVDREGRVKIADFGLAKFVAGDGAAAQNSLEGRATFTGLAVGTPDYTAPEQLKGGPVDHRADIYSLGVMFYEMLTGDLPRGAWTPPSQRTAAPVRLDEVVNRALQSEPDRRYQQASEVKAAVAETGERKKLRAASAPGWISLGMLLTGVTLLSLSRQTVIPGVILTMTAAGVWLYQKPERRWMVAPLAAGLVLWPLFKFSIIGGLTFTVVMLGVILGPLMVLAVLKKTRRAALAILLASGAFLFADGLKALAFSGHSGPRSSTASPEATAASITKMQEVCAYYDECLKILNQDLAGNKWLEANDIKTRERDASRMEGMMREALALGMDNGHPLAVEARRKYDELMRLNKEWAKSSTKRNFAMARAAALEAAIRKFGESRGWKEAGAIWNYKSAEDRFGLVRNYLDYAPANLHDYTPEGFLFVFPERISPVSVDLKLIPLTPGQPGERAIADLNESINQLADFQSSLEKARQQGITRFWTLEEQKSFEKRLYQISDAVPFRIAVGFSFDDPKVMEATRRLSLVRETLGQMMMTEIPGEDCVSRDFRLGSNASGSFPENEDLVPGLRVHAWKGEHPMDAAVCYVETRAIEPKIMRLIGGEPPLEKYPEFWHLEMPLERPRLPAANPQSNAELQWIEKTWAAECAADGLGLVLAEFEVDGIRDNPQLKWAFWSRSRFDDIPWAKGEPQAGKKGEYGRLILKGGKCYTVYDTAPRPQLFGGTVAPAIIWGARTLTHHGMPQVLDAILGIKVEPGELPPVSAWQKELLSRYGDYTAPASAGYWEEAAKSAPQWTAWRADYDHVIALQRVNTGRGTEEGIPFHPWRKGRVLVTKFVCSREVAEKIAASCGAFLPKPDNLEELNQIWKLLPDNLACHSGFRRGEQPGEWVPQILGEPAGKDALVLCGANGNGYLRAGRTRALLVLEWPNYETRDPGNPGRRRVTLPTIE